MQDRTTKPLIVSNTGVRNPNNTPELVSLFNDRGERIQIPSTTKLNTQYGPPALAAGRIDCVIALGENHDIK